MEHYFIYICNEKPTSKEHTLVLNYINSLLPIPGNIGHIYADINSLPILKCSANYLAVINACTREKSVKWTKVDIEMTLSHLTLESKQDSEKGNVEDSNMIPKVEDSSLKENRVEDSNGRDIDKDQILSTKLNYLADELPASGSYKLDVVISQNVLKELSVSKDLEFAGSLYRLFLWHFAHTTIVIDQEEEELNLTEWCNIIDAEVLKGRIDSVLGPVIWRGSIQFRNPNISHPGFQLRLDPFENEIKLKETDETLDLEFLYEHLTLSPYLQVIDECSFASIPIYLILPIAFRVCISEPNTFNEHSKKLLDCFNQNIGAALIVRLQYSILYEMPKPDKSLSTSKWQKMISSGNIKCPDSCFPVLEKYLTFAITTSIKSGNVIAYPLRDTTSLDAKFYFRNLSLFETKHSQHFEVNETSDDDIFSLEVPYLPQHSFQALINKINLSELDLKETCCKDEHSTLNGCCLESLLQAATKSFPVCSLALDKNELHVIEEKIDPSDWPERVHLLQKQMQTDNEKKNVPPNVFLNLNPKHAQKTISFSCQDAEKHFLPSGEAKNGTNFESKSDITDSTKPVMQDVEELSHSEWPKALTCKYDDIYYNCGQQAEVKESVGNEMVRSYVQHETACTCNRQQLKTDPTIVIRTKSKPAIKYKSPATPRSKRFSKAKHHVDTNSSQPNPLESLSRLKRTSSNMDNIVKGLKGYKKLSVKRNVLPVRCSPRKKSVPVRCSPRKVSVPVRCSPRKMSVPVRCSPGKKSVPVRCSPRKVSVPVRCSPRKKSVPVEYSQSNTRNSGENKKRTSDPQQLPEILTKKLRVAVASALEKNGIGLKDAFFRPCGRRLFAICQAFVQDIPRQKGSTSQHMQKIADAHVKQVIEFERQKQQGC